MRNRNLAGWIFATAVVTLLADISAGCFVVPRCEGCDDFTPDAQCNDAADCEAYSDACNSGVCLPGGVCGKEPANEGKACGNADKTRCEDGRCVGCVASGDCPSQTACKTWECSPDGECLSVVGATSLLAKENAPNDCMKPSCSESGNVIQAQDPDDFSTDSSECTDDICDYNGVPSHPPLASGTSCSGGVCDGEGSCVECVDDVDCAPASTSCKKAVCATGECKLQAEADGQSCNSGNGLCHSGQCLHYDGFPCGTNETLCASGFCAEGVCCDEACNGGCESCRLGNRGKCEEVPYGHKGQCRDTDLCVLNEAQKLACLPGDSMGNGAIGTTCSQPANCQSPSVECSEGTCQKGTSRSCGSEASAWVCSSNRCAKVTAEDGTVSYQCQPPCGSDSDCGGEVGSCSSGKCLLKTGASCGLGNDCASGYCVDGVCCDSECLGECMHCALPASLGICSLVPAGVDPDDECSGDAVCMGNGNCQ